MKTKTKVMADIETMGVTPGSAIVSLGAVKFDLTGIQDKFYRRICLKSNLGMGLTIDPDTLSWWMKQSDGARAELVNPDNSHLAQVLQEFNWMEVKSRCYEKIDL